jgi:membrane-bound ClpP family serine protease
MFRNDIRAFVPQIAMSAGTIIACACKEIYMGKHSNLGPVDPQINGIPAYAVIAELKTAYDEMIADQKKQFVWNPILSRYTPSFVQQCQWAVQNGQEFVGQFLRDNMFASLPAADRDARVNAIVVWLTDLSKNKGHDRHIHYQECQDMGLKVTSLEDPADKKLQDLVLTVHHCFMYTLSNTGAFKIIENHVGRRFVKIQQQMVLVGSPTGGPPTAAPLPASTPVRA